MKKQFLLLFLFGLLFTNEVSAQRLEWVARFGGIVTDAANHVAIDASGNSYIVGSFQSTADFDPSPSTTYELTAGGTGGGYVCKLDASGNFVWAKSITGGSGTLANCSKIIFDNSGDLLIAGSFKGNVSFAGTTSITGAANDIFVMKMTTSGTLSWVKQMGGFNNESVTSMKKDASGNIYCLGTFEGTADFNPDPATENYLTTSPTYPTAYTDVFICKLNASGEYQWAKQLGRTGLDEFAGDFVVDASEAVWLSGAFNGTMDFNPDPAVTNNLTSAGGNDLYILQLNASGNYVSAYNVGSVSGGEGANRMEIDGSGNIYLVGYYQYSFDVDPGSGTTTLVGTENLRSNAFIIKLNNAGALIWAKGFLAPTSQVYNYGLGIDGTGNVYVAGDFFGTTDFDPGDGAHNITSKGDYDIFVSKLDASGNFLWVFTLGDSEVQTIRNVVFDGSNNFYIIGAYKGTFDFNPGSGETTITSRSGNYTSLEAFTGKFNLITCVDAATPIITGNPSACLGETTTLTVAGDLNDAVDWHWYGGSCGGAEISTGPAINISPSSATTYYVRGEGFCTTAGTCDEITIDICTGILDFSTEVPDITVYPNPAKEMVNVEATGSIEELVLVDMNGKELRNQQHSSTIRTDQLTKGIYYLKIKTSTGIFHTKIQIE